MYKTFLTLALLTVAGLAQAQERQVVQYTTLAHGIDTNGHSFGVRTEYTTTTYMGQTKQDTVTKTTTRIPGHPDSVVYVTDIGDWPKQVKAQEKPAASVTPVPIPAVQVPVIEISQTDAEMHAQSLAGAARVKAQAEADAAHHKTHKPLADDE
jgi:hypothetical protein